MTTSPSPLTCPSLSLSRKCTRPRPPADIYRTEPTRRRECLYFLAVGHYKLGNYPEAKRYNGRSTRPSAPLLSSPTLGVPLHNADKTREIYPHRSAMLLEKEPNNIQAQSLKQLIEAAVAKGAFFFPLVPSTSFTALRGTNHSYTLDLHIQRDTSGWPLQAEQPPQPASSLQLSWAPKAVDSSPLLPLLSTAFVLSFLYQQTLLITVDSE